MTIMHFFDDIQLVRARKTDPATSKRAALESVRFAESHAGRILRCLQLHGKRDTHQIAQITGLEVCQVDRRKIELERSGLVKVVDTSGKYSVLEAV
jgi:hypothetical protein